jgi:hypothetical protein
MKVFNLHGDAWDRAEEREGWHSSSSLGPGRGSTGTARTET